LALSDHPDYTGKPYYTPQQQWVFLNMNATQVNAACLAAHSGADAWKCFFAEYTLPFITTPFFATQDLVDSWQLANILRLPCMPYDPKCTDPAVLAATQAYRQSMLTALAPLLSSSSNGLYGSACIQHCHQNIEQVWSQELVQNQTVQASFVSWWAATGQQQRQVVDGPYGSNKHCYGVPYGCTS
jgi:hypothetical protein